MAACVCEDAGVSLGKSTNQGGEMKRTVITEKIRAAVITDYHLITPSSELAAKYSFGLSTVARILASANIKRRKGKLPNMIFPLSKGITIETLVEEYQSGMSCADLAQKYGVTSATVYKVLKTAGVSRSRKEARFIRKGIKSSWPCNQGISVERIVKEFRRGSSTEKIAKKYHVSYCTVYKILKDAGAIDAKKYNMNKVSLLPGGALVHGLAEIREKEAWWRERCHAPGRLGLSTIELLMIGNVVAPADQSVEAR